MRVLAVLLASALWATPSLAACPIELAIYREAKAGAQIEFLPTGPSAALTNSFRLVLENSPPLEGMVAWSEGEARPRGQVTRDCPEGDATGAEIAACTAWLGVIYSVDDKGLVALLPAEGVAAPPTLLLPDLGPSLLASTVFEDGGLSKVPWDSFALAGCQE